MQVGYHPEIDIEEVVGIKFSLRAVIAINGDHLFLSEDEFCELFTSLQESEKFEKNGCVCVANAKFKIRSCDSMLLVAFNEEPEIKFSPMVLECFMNLCPSIKGYMINRRALREHFESELFNEFEEAAKKCRNDGTYLKTLAGDSNSLFVVELYANFNSIFLKYCENRRHQQNL